MMKQRLQYFFIRALMLPLSFAPYRMIHFLGRCFGTLSYYCLTEWRKRTLSNLALAKDLQLSEKELIKTAKKAFQNLAISCLEYARFSREKTLDHIIHCENPEKANELYKKGQGIIFFCGHLANWETLFLDGTSRMKGIAIGKPIKNKILYQWIISIRQKYGGKIIDVPGALSSALRYLKKGYFVGIVGDQGVPNSSYQFSFFGRRSKNSTAAALLAYKTNSPIIVATNQRIKGVYKIRYSDPLWPDLSKPLEKEVVRLMDLSLTLLQKGIEKSPGDWLWQHNRYKTQTPKNVYHRFRKDCILIISEEKYFSHLKTLREIYPQEFLFLLIPQSTDFCIGQEKTFFYQNLKDLLLKDYRFKMVFNFTSHTHIRKHYKKFSCSEILDISDLQKLANSKEDLSTLLKKSLCRST